jgi:hypothetical protein
MPVATAEIPAAELTREFEDFFAEHPQAAILEDGRVIFDMRSARYSLSSEQRRCLLLSGNRALRPAASAVPGGACAALPSLQRRGAAASFAGDTLGTNRLERGLAEAPQGNPG